MRSLEELIDFLNNNMLMSEVYQPAIILYLLEGQGKATKAELATVLSGYDESFQEYYQKIVMRWPKITLTNHNIINYQSREKTFYLNFDLSDEQLAQHAKQICETKIQEWIEERTGRMSQPRMEASKRYRVLKAAKGKCELCGISSKIIPIDIDHIVPQSKADKTGYIDKDGIRIPVDDERNLQALCMRCNRAKRNNDETDFRQPDQKLVRDFIPEIINASGRKAIIRQLSGIQLQQSLMDKLVEEHAELIAETNIEEISDMIEVLVSLAKQLGFSEDETITQVMKKRSERGGFDAGWLLANGNHH